MTERDKYADLVKLLTETTRDGEADWSTTPDPDTFRLEIVPAGYVRITKEMRAVANVASVPVFRLTLLNQDGVQTGEWSPEDSSDNSLLRGLHTSASQVARRVDETYNAMIQVLQAKRQANAERRAQREPVME